MSYIYVKRDLRMRNITESSLGLMKFENKLISSLGKRQLKFATLEIIDARTYVLTLSDGTYIKFEL